MDGGSRRSGKCQLALYNEYNNLKVDWEQKKRLCEQLGAKKHLLEANFHRFSSINAQLKMKESVLQNTIEQIKETTFQQALDDVEEMKKEVQKKTDQLKALHDQCERISAEADDLDRQIKDFEREKERKTNEMKQKIKEEKSKLGNL
jgi:chromosome segregation ATPase